MAVEDSVAQDQIRAFVERIERMEEEKRALSDDIKAIYQEARGNGFDVKVLRRVVNIRKQDPNDRMEQEALLELYMSALGMVEAPPEYQDDERDRLNSLRSQVAASLRQEKAEQKTDPIAALRANPAMSIVDVANLKSNPEAKTSTDGGATEQGIETPADSVTGEASRASVGAGSDATIQPETANDDRSCVSVLGGLTQSLQQQATREGEAARPLPPTVAETDKSVEASASAAPAPKYAAPGVVTWETFPPEGVERGAISMAFGTMGQDAAVIADELERGAAQPIVKKGRVILDGWARYMAARNMVELDGSPMAYPVVQYAGTDLLVDIIKLNVDGRILTDDQKRKIAANLSRQEPNRKEDIYRAFELWLEPV